MESFLKEQLKRIQELTERMTSLEHRAAELSNEMARDREALRQDPLQDVRDFRMYCDPMYQERRDEFRRERAIAEDAPRRRRRRR